MDETQKELAFLRDLYVTPDWTQRFAALVDKHLDAEDVENLLYMNAGTGDHCFSIREKFDENTAIFATCENEQLLSIAKDKAIALRSDVDLSMLEFEDDSFDAVIVDASLMAPDEVSELVYDSVRAARSGGTVTFFLPSSGSFGEVHSLLWEVLFNEDLGDHGHDAETMITEIASVESLKQLAASSGLSNLRSETVTEIFEFEDGNAFVESSLVANFLLPRWLKNLDENEKERVTSGLAQLIDEEDGTLSFRFSVKATVITGVKK